MKRKLRIFSSIAVICLSVCMFAFGVYAASTVSVTTSGTVSFNASGVFAKITRTVTGAKSNPENFEQSIDASVSDSSNSFKMGDGELLEFADASTPIVMTFTIENLATDRNLNLQVIDNNGYGDNVLDICVVSGFMFDNVNQYYNINPKAPNLDNTETITITFTVKDANKSASIGYNYSVILKNQDNIATGIEDSEGITRFGNTYLVSSQINQGKQLGYKLSGTAKSFEYPPEIINTNTVISPIFIFTEGLTEIQVFNENINAMYTITKVSDGYAHLGQNWDVEFAVDENTYLPVVVNDLTNGVMVISGIEEGNDYMFYNSKLTITHFPGGLVELTSAFGGCNNLKVSGLPVGVTKLDDQALSGCNNLELISLPDGIVELGYGAFGSSEKISLTKLPSALKKVGDNCFNGMFPYVKLNSLPKGLESIGESWGLCINVNNSNSEFTIYNNLKEIGNNAMWFNSGWIFDCGKINFMGTQAEWELIEEQMLTCDGLDSFKVIFADGTSKIIGDGYWGD